VTTSDQTEENVSLDTQSVGRWLAEHVDGFSNATTFTRIGEGQSALSYMIANESGYRVVLRRPPIGEPLESAHDMGREFKILSGLGSVWPKVPRVLGYCDDIEVTGVPFYVMEFIAGLTINRLQIAEGMTVDARRACGPSLVTTLLDLQSIDISSAGLDELRRPKSFIERQLRRWTSQWEAQGSRELPEVAQLRDAFLERLPEERRTVFVHGDYGMHNALFDQDGNVRAVLDWELTTTGDPLADLGQMMAYWTENGAPAREPNAVFREPVTELDGFVGAWDLATTYATESDEDISDLGFWVAFAYWKIAIIVEGVYSRWRTDPTNGMGAGELGAAVPRLANLALQALESGTSH